MIKGIAGTEGSINNIFVVADDDDVSCVIGTEANPKK
jgi:hypothetical protein